MLRAAAIAAAALAGAAAGVAIDAAPERSALAPAPLGRATFAGNVLEGGHVEHWFVLFCAEWYDRCEEVRRSYASAAGLLERAHNAGAVLSLKVRFGEVNCATEKVLCNEQGVAVYPTLAHYRDGARMGVREVVGQSLEKEAVKARKWFEASLQTPPQVENLPSPSGHVRVLLRAAATLAALVSMVVWLTSAGSELRRAARLSDSSVDKSAARPGGRDRHSVESILPAAWADERPKLDL